jgi:hypothetical protein
VPLHRDAPIVVDETPADLGECLVKLLGYLGSRLTVDVLPLATDLISGLPATVLPLEDGPFSLCPSHGSPFDRGSDRVLIGIER